MPSAAVEAARDTDAPRVSLTEVEKAFLIALAFPLLCCRPKREAFLPDEPFLPPQLLVAHALRTGRDSGARSATAAHSCVHSCTLHTSGFHAAAG